VLRRALDRFVDFLARALDLGVVELVRRLGAERAGLDRRREDGFAERLGRLPFTNPADPQKIIDGLAKAGLPD